jgi:hypothetical protein
MVSEIEITKIFTNFSKINYTDMKSIQINILSDNDELEVMNLLSFLEKKDVISVGNIRNLSIPGKPLTINELNEQLDISRKSKSYTASEAKAILGL